MAKQKYYVALLNLTDREVSYAEDYTDRAEAIRRVQVGLEPQAMLNAMGAGGDPSTKGKEWAAWGPETEPFAWPEEPKE
jgi:hypothetical protein